MTHPDKSNAARPLVLLAEDNDNDVELTKLAFTAAGFEVDLQCVGDGEACLNYLRDPKRFTRPNLILLDLHMPRMNGLEVLQAIGQDELLRTIPVVMLTTSDAPDDVEAAYRLGCNSYIVKPVGFEAFAKLIADLMRYWFSIVALPSSTRVQAHTQSAHAPSARIGTSS
jgi:CheY-like chemotaxis protein